MEPERHYSGCGDDSERYVAIAACMGTIGEESRAVEAVTGAESDACGELVPDESDPARDGEGTEVMKVLGVDETVDRFSCGDDGRDEDDQDDRDARPALSSLASKHERDAERYCGEGITTVVDEVSEQRDRSGHEEDRELQGGGDCQNGKADRDCLDAIS
jgi:hypothetical protein